MKSSCYPHVFFQIEDIPNTMAPILMEVLQQNAPEGVNICVKTVRLETVTRMGQGHHLTVSMLCRPETKTISLSTIALLQNVNELFNFENS